MMILIVCVVISCLFSMLQEKDHVLTLNLETNVFNKALVTKGVNK